MRVFRSKLYGLAASLPLTAFLLAGCGGGGNGEYQESANAEEAASKLEKEFKNADPAAQKQVSETTKALKKKKYEKAAQNLRQLQSRTNLNFNQRMQVEDATRQLNAEIAEALESDDPAVRKRAQRALKRLDTNPGD